MMPNQKANRNYGFSLVEILISLAILAIGLLAIAGLQITSLRSNNSAYLYSQATFASYDIMDRMRANRNHALAEFYNLELDFLENDDIINITENFLNNPEIPQVIYDDILYWITNLSNNLPQLRKVSIGLNADIATVVIKWNESRSEIEEEQDLTEFRTQSQL
ncbi:type IV pilus modification protein PilV [Desulfonatronovibrio magnus]|uniref:type IV pilus modification protein PilV n=1 Tax=Desulfonatronovibrio magnus TaxID=698827 RepID=UPI0018DB521B|nr:type IV pilus modification protein PilV [Desulfonatronovibrio magnus]